MYKRQVITYAIGAHPYANYHSDDLPLGNYAQFATRYSSLIWDVNRLKPLAHPETQLEVKSPGPIWWKEMACTRQTAEGKRQYIVHLVNPPVQELSLIHILSIHAAGSAGKIHR